VVKLKYAQPDAANEPASKIVAPGPSNPPANPTALPAPAPAVSTPQSNIPGAPSPGTPPAPGGPPAAPAPSANVTFMPAQVETIMGGPISVNVVIANATDLFSAPLQIRFDPKVLKLNDAVQGNLMSSDGQQVTFTKNILNDTGEADITLNRLPGAGGVTGSGILATLSFSTIGRGSTSVTAPAFSPTNSQGQPIANSSPLLTVNVK